MARGGASGLAMAAGTPIDRAALKAIEHTLQSRETIDRLETEGKRKAGE
jgi:hypothetical protein